MEHAHVHTSHKSGRGGIYTHAHMHTDSHTHICGKRGLSWEEGNKGSR